MIVFGCVGLLHCSWCDFSSLVTGTYQVCAILNDGSLKCWGSNHEMSVTLDEEQDSLIDATGDSLPRINLGKNRTCVQVLGKHVCRAAQVFPLEAPSKNLPSL